MTGKYIEFINPGYSTLYTRDLQYSPNTTGSMEAATLNPFDPDSANPLVEGEWLTLTTGGKCTRPGDAAAASEGQNMSGSSACMMHFHEKGRYDAQISRKAHLVTGPAGFEFKCKLGNFTGAAEGERVFVGSVLVGALYKSGLCSITTIGASGDYQSTFAMNPTTNQVSLWSPGYISRFISASECNIVWAPQIVIMNAS